MLSVCKWGVKPLGGIVRQEKSFWKKVIGKKKIETGLTGSLLPNAFILPSPGPDPGVADQKSILFMYYLKF